MAGNVTEILLEEGYHKGGSFFTKGFYLKNSVERYNQRTAFDIGFRVVMIVQEH